MITDEYREQLRDNLSRFFVIKDLADESGVPYFSLWRFVKKNGRLADDHLLRIDDVIQKIMRGDD